MKGSPIIATIVTIVALLGIYLGIRSVISPAQPPAATKQFEEQHHDHDHSHQNDEGHEHAHDDHEDHSHHDDSNVETQFELYFSSPPKSVRIVQPSTNKEVLHITEIDDVEWTGEGSLSLDGHHIELTIDVVWEQPTAINFVQMVVHPDNHESRERTLRDDSHISDIAEFRW